MIEVEALWSTVKSIVGATHDLPDTSACDRVKYMRPLAQAAGPREWLSLRLQRGVFRLYGISGGLLRDV